MYNRSDKGVSPVIGVILMVAVTVALVALVTVVVFDIGDDVSEPADITVNTDVQEGETVELTVEVVRNENVDTLVADGAGLVDQEIVTETGEVTTESFDSEGDDGDDLDGDSSGTVELVATVGDSEEIVTTVDIPEDES